MDRKGRWTLSIMEKFLKSAEDKDYRRLGLSQREAEKKLEIFGHNTIMIQKRVSPLKILLDQFSDFMVLILLASTAISAFMGEMTEAVTIISIVIVNAILGFIQEYRTEKTLEALKSLAAPTARVIRDGKTVIIPAELVVPDDIIELEAGDRVPADAVLISSNSLQVDESLLTGESVPVEKDVYPQGGRKTAEEQKNNKVFMGTIVTGGKARAMVYATGMNTEMGKIAGMIQEIEDEQTPLQKRLDHLGKVIVYGCLAICAVVSVAGILRGEELFTMLLSGISLAVAAVPEGLPAIVTIALALGVQRMLKKNALIRKLPAVETLGCATVICSDKTGTLTENRMTVRKIYAGGSLVEVKGISISSPGEFSVGNRIINPIKDENLRLALEIGALCNNARIVKVQQEEEGVVQRIKSRILKQESFTISGDPTEGALLTAAYGAGLTPEMLEKYYYRVDEIPFDSDRKCMSVICRNQRGELLVFTKGAPDVIIEKCTKIKTASGISTLSPSQKSSVMRINDRMAGEALRVLGLAYKKLSAGTYDRRNAEKDLIFVGLTGMIDPPRKEALEAVQKCRLAGIKPVMITGDHKGTAAAIAREVGIYKDGDMVLTGVELDTMSETSLERIAQNVSVYARVSPRHKLMIVRALKKLGNVVAMTGDGVNDAPAIKEADIGVSMGITGTDVTKEASSMILMDDNFATIVSAVEEGRVIYNNIRKFIRYLLSCNIGEVLTMFVGMLIGLPIPLLPIQILWVNLVTDGLPAIALSLEPAEKDIMMIPPREPDESIFSRGLIRLIIFRGVLIALCTLVVFTSMLYFTGDVDRARTGAFLTIVMTQLIHVFECKSERRTIFEIPFLNNPALILSVMCSVAMMIVVIYIPALQPVFNTVALDTNDWLIVSGFSFIGPVLASFLRASRGKRVRQKVKRK